MTRDQLEANVKEICASRKSVFCQKLKADMDDMQARLVSDFNICHASLHHCQIVLGSMPSHVRRFKSVVMDYTRSCEEK